MNDSRRKTLIAVALGLITFVLYSPSLGHDFLSYDDQQYVTECPQVRAGLTYGGFVWSFGYHAGNWHPLTWLSHMLDTQLFGLHPAGHHLTSVLLHVANTILLFIFLSGVTGATWRGAGAAALFAWHPLHVESVAWIAERKDVLCTFFWLLTALSYVRYVRQIGSARSAAKKWYMLVLANFALALLSKPMAVTLPCVLLLLDFWPLRRAAATQFPGNWWTLLCEKAPLFLMVILVCGLTLAAQEQALAPVDGLDIPHRCWNALVAYQRYLTAMLAPINLAVFYPYNRVLPWEKVLGAAVLLAGITAFGIKVRGRHPYILVGWLWFLGTLVPVIGLVQVGDQAWADRYTYIPLIGLFIGITWTLGEHLRSRILAAGLALITSGFLMALTSAQLKHWQNTETLFTHTAGVTQNNHMAIAMLGSLLAREGKLSEAIANYRQALTMQPRSPEAHFLLGNALDQQGHLDAAIVEYRQAVWFQPLKESTHVLLGIALSKQKLYDEATRELSEAIRINPNSAVAFNALARIQHAQGQLETAMKDYKRAVQLDPLLPQVHNNLGVVLLQLGRGPEAIAYLRESVRLNPTNNETRLNLALALTQSQQWEVAAALFREIVHPQFNDPNAHYQFGIALEKLGQTRAAVSQFAQAVLLQSDFPAALDRLAWILSTSPESDIRNGPQALGMAQRACLLSSEPRYQMTLAAALAENGDFDSALGSLNRVSITARTNLTPDWVSFQNCIANRKPWRTP